jgi:probable rRNA maturation factor
LRVHLKRDVKVAGADGSGIRRFAKSVLRGEDVEEGGVTIVLTDDEGIRELNRRFRGLDRATDVLSFPLGEEDEAGVYLGDVVVSLDRALAQAPRFGSDPETELARLISHGILHLLGYDHQVPADARKMKEAERHALLELAPGTLWPDAERRV